MDRQEAYVAIVGGGMSGMLAAIALAHNGFSSIMIDRETPQTPNEFDGRTTALAYGAVRLMERLGLWHSLSEHACPMTDIMITDGTPSDRFRNGHQSDSYLHFKNESEGKKKPLGFIVENRHLREALQLAVDKNDQCTFSKGSMTGYYPSSAGVKIETDTGTTISSSLVLACDGRTSRLRAMAGIRSTTKNFRQTALTFALEHTTPHENIAHQYFLPNGPFAILPMSGNQSSIIWTENSELTPALLALPQDQFLQQLQNRLGALWGDVTLASEIFSYPLSRTLPTKFFADRLVLIGDAAHNIHPIAGQGFNLGVKDIAALCDVICEMRDTGLDIGHGSALEKYDRWRRYDTTTMALGSDGFNALFSQQSRPLRTLRSIGMSAIRKIEPLNSRLTRHAGADLGDVPSLMKA